ncbi:hypothetical protein QF042_001044 [Pedobacter sp. W3I1]|uniref:DUF6610 family protein n=1 Tax=Pedobacter sp. W3I1 TaxID=3042291 RepID=UPI0027805CEE|nr:DUF6610 family protein [Pedobacter sp. W3I1]MDQ0637479.1 hypothetical protein [Pedobacter sp. W3I1]
MKIPLIHILMIDKIVTHSKTVLDIAKSHNWLIGAKYTNLRDVATFEKVHFIDIDWKNYNFERHLDAVKKLMPKYTVAKDWEEANELSNLLGQVDILSKYCEHVIIVPKVDALKEKMLNLIPKEFMLGYSVPTKYGGTTIEPQYFDERPVHLLGGRPEKQRELGKILNVRSIDGNRFTLDAGFGDYFDGVKFRPHPRGGYKVCIEDSIKNINQIWKNYGQ